LSLKLFKKLWLKDFLNSNIVKLGIKNSVKNHSKMIIFHQKRAKKISKKSSKQNKKTFFKSNPEKFAILK